jgi:hypothetical protein
MHMNDDDDQQHQMLFDGDRHHWFNQLSTCVFFFKPIKNLCFFLGNLWDLCFFWKRSLCHFLLIELCNMWGMINLPFFQLSGPRLYFLRESKKAALFYPKIIMEHYYSHMVNLHKFVSALTPACFNCECKIRAINATRGSCFPQMT